MSFAYEDGERPTLTDVDLVVPAGTSTAIVGETGSGKTTLGYLVARLYDADAGRVAIDGVDVRDLSFAALARTVGLVSQETYLFHASVRDNLRFAKADATDEEIETAARAAQVHELIAALPEGYDTVVGERGYRFSGGEKQRIAIARTLLRNPPILVLDEATSALDNQTERAVQEALDRLIEGRTTITIAHRLSTVRDADEIVVLDAGRIAERGTHDELLAAGGPLRGAAGAGRRAGRGMTVLASVTVGDAPEVWSALGFAVRGDRIRVGGIELCLGTAPGPGVTKLTAVGEGDASRRRPGLRVDALRVAARRRAPQRRRGARPRRGRHRRPRAHHRRAAGRGLRAAPRARARAPGVPARGPVHPRGDGVRRGIRARVLGPRVRGRPRRTRRRRGRARRRRARRRAARPPDRDAAPQRRRQRPGGVPVRAAPSRL